MEICLNKLLGRKKKQLMKKQPIQQAENKRIQKSIKLGELAENFQKLFCY